MAYIFLSWLKFYLLVKWAKEWFLLETIISIMITKQWFYSSSILSIPTGILLWKSFPSPSFYLFVTFFVYWFAYFCGLLDYFYGLPFHWKCYNPSLSSFVWMIILSWVWPVEVASNWFLCHIDVCVFLIPGDFMILWNKMFQDHLVLLLL